MICTAITDELLVPILRSDKIRFSSPLNKTLNLIIPTGSSNAEEDCICPLVFTQNKLCTNLSEYWCIANTTFTPSMIEICQSGPVEVTIVLKNLSPSTNNTRLFFYTYDKCCEENNEIGCDEFYWECVKSYEIMQGM